MERREIASCLAMKPAEARRDCRGVPPRNDTNPQTKKALCIFLAVEQRTGRQTKLMFHLTKPIL